MTEEQQFIFQNTPINKDKSVLDNHRHEETPSGVPFFIKNNCSLCKQHFPCLTPIDFSKIVWIHGSSIEHISKNKDLKFYELELCDVCRNRIFAASVPAIKFSQRLFNAMAGGDD